MIDPKKNPLDCDHNNDGYATCSKCNYNVIALEKAELTCYAVLKALEIHSKKKK